MRRTLGFAAWWFTFFALNEQFVSRPDDRDFVFQIIFYPIQMHGVVFATQSDGFAFGSGTCGSANPVDIIFRVLRQVVVEDMGDVIDMDTA